MRIGPFELTRRRKGADLVTRFPAFFARGGSGGWWPIIREPFAGAWQRSVAIDRTEVLAYSTVYACMSLIAGDIAKLGIDLIEQDDDVWTPTTNPAYSPVLRAPNHYQNRIQFIESWILSKLQYGNVYILKERDNRNMVSALYVLDPMRVTPMIATTGDVFYQTQPDFLAGLQSDAAPAVPARDMIHDRMNCMFHPLVGIPPIIACGLSATQGLRIQQTEVRQFDKGVSVGGIVTVPGVLSPEGAAILERKWSENYAGEDNTGKIAVLTDGMTFKPNDMLHAVNAEVIDQLKWTGENVCSCFHVPPFMVGIGQPPAGQTVQSLLLLYYAQALQSLIEALELCLDEGLDLSTMLGIRVDVDALLRMDTGTAMKVATDGVGGGLLTVNEGRRRFDLKKVPGGDTPYLQEQYFSLAALNKRDTAAPAPPTPDNPTPKPPPHAGEAPKPAPDATPGDKPAAKPDAKPDDTAKAIADAVRTKSVKRSIEATRAAA